LFNFSDKEFQIKTGDRIAQLIIEKITETEIEEVEDLDQTERGAGGFGSTGVSEKIINNDSVKNENGTSNGKEN
jgi:dUTP pyrophosphatase